MSDARREGRGRMRGWLGAIVLSLTAGCSSSSSLIAVTCVTMDDAGTTGSCVIQKNQPSSNKGSVTNACTSQGGDVASACPASGLVGCCSLGDANEAVTETCYYAGNVPSLAASCSGGTWTNTP